MIVAILRQHVKLKLVLLLKLSSIPLCSIHLSRYEAHKDISITGTVFSWKSVPRKHPPHYYTTTTSLHSGNKA